MPDILAAAALHYSGFPTKKRDCMLMSVKTPILSYEGETNGKVMNWALHPSERRLTCLASKRYSFGGKLALKSQY